MEKVVGLAISPLADIPIRVVIPELGNNPNQLGLLFLDD
jgi:hypothetical protein